MNEERQGEPNTRKVKMALKENGMIRAKKSKGKVEE